MKRTDAPDRRTNWVPTRYGLYDETPKLKAAIKAEAIKFVDLERSDRLRELEEAIDIVPKLYWQTLHLSQAPRERFYAVEIKPVLSATEKLITAISGLGALARGRLAHRTPPLSRRHGLSDLEQHLHDLAKACRASLRKGQPGAPAKTHITETVQRLMKIWAEFSGRPFPLNVRAQGDAFITTSAQFVLTVLQGIDPNVTLGEVARAIRAVHHRQRAVQKTRPS